MKLANLYLSLVLIISIFNANASETTEFYDAHFEHDQDVLTKTELLKLKEHISTLGLTDAYEVIITGHTDAIGSDEYNMQLSERRTKFILYSLLHFGLDEGVVSIDWKGESDPIDMNNNDRGRAKNRRVEIAIKRYTFNTTEDLRSALTQNRAQQFIIDPKTDQLIVGNAGVQVSIPANSFVDRDGNPITGNVTVEMKEALTFGSFHDYGLSTTSGNQLLETGGMIFLDAKDENGNQLSLNEDSQLSMLLPAESKEEGMELFTSNDGGDWQQVGQQPATPAWSSFATFGRYDGPIRPSWNFMPPRMTLDRKPPKKPAPPQKPRAP
ncbi:MAG: OmpA family protein, partial [Flavobacteriales bacterium]|nr:OmpA family protein [Flavobacteriales bacterium]